MSSNSTIAKNTIFLYVRMIIIMLIGFYTVRAILDLLGVVDYGVYNVVGGVVAMFSFLNGTLASSSQRYFSVDLAKGDTINLNKTFCLNINVFLILAGFIVVIAETIGLWFVNYKMTIPVDRLFAANVVYQLSIITFVISLISVPYNALIIAHEEMKAFAKISIIEALLKLCVVAILSFTFVDRLIVYGILMFVVSSSITASYIVYCHHNFPESKYSLYWNKVSAFEILSFSGWHFLGTISSVLRTQGINILINLFFNPAVNAARAVSVQVSSAVTQLSSNFFVAVKPQMYKSYAIGDFHALEKLIMRSTIICAFLVSIMVIPLVICTDFVLALWLKEVPEHASLFTKLILWHSLIYSINGATIVPALATGNIKRFEIWTSGLNCLILPISYAVLKLGGSPESTVVVAMIMATLTILLQAYMLRCMLLFPFWRYVGLIVKLFIVSITLWACLIYIPHFCSNWLLLITVTVFSLILHIILYALFVMEKEDLASFRTFILKKLKKHIQ